MTDIEMKIEIFAVNEEEEVLRLLSETELPTEDITIDKLKNFLIAKREDGSVVGAIGIEAYQDVGLLRSLVVHPSYRDRGFGKLLTNEIEKYAQTKGIKALFLLTTTAIDFFPMLGYQLIQKTSVPETIAETEEFKNVCPASAVCYLKNLNETNGLKVKILK
jgi:amino-acid N-acetyltransferase